MLNFVINILKALAVTMVAFQLSNLAILAAGANRQSRGGKGLSLSYPVVGSEIIYKGAIVSVDTDGYLAPASDTASEFVVGIADETVDNSGGSSGDVNCRVLSGRAFLLPATSLAQTDVGTSAAVVNDNEVEVVAAVTNNVIIGRIVEFVSATSVWVLIPEGGQPV